MTRPSTMTLFFAALILLCIPTAVPVGADGGPNSEAVQPTESVVADVDGKLVILNQGKNAGYHRGDKFGIYHKFRIVKDPETGKVLTVRFKKVGAIKLTRVYDIFAEGKIISGSGFIVGDRACKIEKKAPHKQ